MAFLWVEYFSEENYREFCDFVYVSNYHHFKVDENDACDIRWTQILKEPVLFTLIILTFVILILKGIKSILKI